MIIEFTFLSTVVEGLDEQTQRPRTTNEPVVQLHLVPFHAGRRPVEERVAPAVEHGRRGRRQQAEERPGVQQQRRRRDPEVAAARQRGKGTVWVTSQPFFIVARSDEDQG